MAPMFAPVATLPKEMTAQELQAWLGGQPDSVVMRSILIAEVEAIRAGEPRERRTMRNLWYEQVKPVLSRAGLLNNITSGGKPIAWDRLLSKYLGELVTAKYTSYEELKIVDGSRQRQPAHIITTGVIDVQLVGDHYPWLIMFTEKDTIWGELQGLADLYGVSAISGGGEPSSACTENTIRAIVRSEAFKTAQPEEIIILSLTDYDPFGYKIANAQYEQVLEAARAMDPQELGALASVTNIRIGLEPSQLTAAERAANAYEPKQTGLDDWYKKTGGVDGRPLGLELDALDLSRLRRMFAENIERHIDLEKRRHDLREAYIDLLACDLLMPDFENKRQAMIEAIRASECWQDILQAKIPSDLFIKAAERGASWIPPSQNKALFSRFTDKAKEIMSEFTGAEN